MSPSSTMASSERDFMRWMCLMTASCFAFLSVPAMRSTSAAFFSGSKLAAGALTAKWFLASDAGTKVAQDEIQGDLVLPPFRDDDIGKALARLDEREVHRPHRFVVLLPHLREGTTPVFQIA